MSLVSRWTLLGVASIAVLAGCQKSAGSGHAPGAGPIERPTGPMDLDTANEYALALVNHDRAEHDLPPVEWNDTAAKAAQRHVEDMVKNGFTAHWGTDGSVPEQRYTEVGGEFMVQENAACFFDAEKRQVDPNATFNAVEIEKIQGAFMAEVPPNDGHRRNILKRWHNRLGVGLAKPVGVDQACLAHEFVDEYGTFDDIPAEAKVGQTITVSGEVTPPVTFGGVGLARIDSAEATPAEQLNTTSTYRVPEPYVVYFPAGFKTPKPVSVDGNRFTIDIQLSQGGKPGRYEVSIWGKYPEDDALVIISLRVVRVR